MVGKTFRWGRILSDYQDLEPGESDTWNPLNDDFELAYRLSLFYCLAQALGVCGLPIEVLRVLDLGCGNGRSTRMYIEFGLMPEQLTGLDLRASAIALAKKLNPAVQHLVQDGDSIPFNNGSFNWISLTTVISSIGNHADRKCLVEEIYEKLSPQGYLFYFDLMRANDFAGADQISPKHLFPRLDIIWHCPIRWDEFLPSPALRLDLLKQNMVVDGSVRRAIRRPRTRKQRVVARARAIVRRCLKRSQFSHECMLFRKP